VGRLTFSVTIGPDCLLSVLSFVWDGGGEMVVPSEDSFWAGGDDANGGRAVIENFRFFASFNLGFDFGPIGFHFANADGFHEKSLAD